MYVTHVVFDETAFGITQRSLKMLRDKLAQAIDHRIVVYEIPTNDLCCGFLILDWNWQSATFTGDGFRMDRGGEGGAGYKTAEALFNLCGIRRFYHDEPINVDALYQGNRVEFENRLLALARAIAKDTPESEFKRPLDSNPEYIRR